MPSGHRSIGRPAGLRPSAPVLRARPVGLGRCAARPVVGPAAGLARARRFFGVTALCGLPLVGRLTFRWPFAGLSLACRLAFRWPVGWLSVGLSVGLGARARLGLDAFRMLAALSTVMSLTCAGGLRPPGPRPRGPRGPLDPPPRGAGGPASRGAWQRRAPARDGPPLETPHKRRDPLLAVGDEGGRREGLGLGGLRRALVRWWAMRWRAAVREGPCGGDRTIDRGFKGAVRWRSNG
ncbi:MAG: hypothetical protein RL071_3786 [Pseudomonadota bacterium]